VLDENKTLRLFGRIWLALGACVCSALLLFFALFLYYFVYVRDTFTTNHPLLPFLYQPTYLFFSCVRLLELFLVIVMCGVGFRGGWRAEKTETYHESRQWRHTTGIGMEIHARDRIDGPLSRCRIEVSIEKKKLPVLNCEL